MRTLVLVLLIVGGVYYWDKGLGDYVTGNYKQFEYNTLRWLKEHTPPK